MGLSSVFLSHYRRHPGQLAGLLLILVCAAMLWSGVRSLTGSAESAVAKSRAAMEPLLSVVREDGRSVTVEDFVRLRRAGLCVSPRLEVRFSASDAPTVVGIDPFTADCLRQYRNSDDRESAEDETPVSGKLLSELDRPVLLGSAADHARWQELSLDGTEDFEFDETDGVPRRQLLTDIAVAAQLASAGRSTLQILLPAAEAENTPLPNEYRGQIQDYGVEPDSLVEAFLLSLDALGALALLVAALLVRSVYGFALEQRRRSLEILVRVGVPAFKLRLALIAEVILVALIAGTLGVWLGEQLASAMADGFLGTLSGLFSVDTLAKSTPAAETWLGMVLILVLVVGWSCIDLLALRHAQPGGTQWGGAQVTGAAASRAQTGKWGWIGAIGLAVVSLAILLSTDTLWVVFAAATGCLIGIGLLLPEVLNWSLVQAERYCLHLQNRLPLMEWSCSEMRALCRLLSLPLTALAFAIATVIGVQAMVTGFESTFSRWLDQRLQGDLYIDPGQPVATTDWRSQLGELPGVTTVLPMVRGRALLVQETRNADLPVDILAVDPASPLVQDWPFIASVSSPWSELPTTGVLINEQLARRQSLGVGDRIHFRIGADAHSREVVGIYADYGRPEGELMLPLALVPDTLPNRYSTFVLGVPDTDKTPWQDWPEQYGWMSGSRLRDQAGLKRAANAAFSRTFQMTRLLNALTLVLAGTALALMGLVIFRLRQGSYTLLHVAGVQRKSLRRRLIVHSMLVTGLLGLLAIPLGIFLGWVLVARVNPAAFGWALPLHFYPGFWLQVWVLCLFIGALVGVLVGNPVRLETLKSE